MFCSVFYALSCVLLPSLRQPHGYIAKHRPINLYNQNWQTAKHSIKSPALVCRSKAAVAHPLQNQAVKGRGQMFVLFVALRACSLFVILHLITRLNTRAPHSNTHIYHRGTVLDYYGDDDDDDYVVLRLAK